MKKKHEEKIIELTAAIPDKFEVSLKLTLKPSGMFKGPAETIQVLQVTANRGAVEALVCGAVVAGWFVQKLRGHVGMPEISSTQLAIETSCAGMTQDTDEDEIV